MEAPSVPIGPPATARRPGPVRHVLVVVGAVLGLVALAFLASLVSRPAAPYPAGTAAAAVQAFIAAYDADDDGTAYALLSSSVRQDLSAEEYAEAWSEMSWRRDEDERVTLIGEDVEGLRATIDLRVETFYGGGLFSSGRTYWDVTVRLVMEAGAWRIDQPLVGLEDVSWYGEG